VSRYFAHSLPDNASQSDWELLYTGTGEGHLEKVAAFAAQFARKFGAGDWGYVSGMWHDLGKYRQEFQAKLTGERIQVEHSGIGAALAGRHGDAGLAIAFCIAGHHAGLADLRFEQNGWQGTTLQERLKRAGPDLMTLLDADVVPKSMLLITVPTVPDSLILPTKAATNRPRRVIARRQSFFVRMLFSALVDADRLATTQFYENAKLASKRRPKWNSPSIDELKTRLDEHLVRLARDAKPTPVNRLRADVLEHCREKANSPPGLFSLTVPTGGGKTLSAMRFALDHAAKHGLERVVVVLPYTTIIEQNAAVYANVFGPENVIEHHSNLDEEKLEEQNRDREILRRLACENWDARIIVTTTVQFFESLFSHRPSQCRKLHNIARSVVILDEVQTLPPRFLMPITEAMQVLATNYGTTVLLTTATPPALIRDEIGLHFGLKDVTPIVANPRELAARLDRVQVQWPELDKTTTNVELAQHISERIKESVLAIVPRREDAREIARLVPRDGSRLHLSALMCPAHRLRVIRLIRMRLRSGKLCRVAATNLVEAGVDLDFPVVFRAMAGLDSLAQAAGRCNREGTLIDENGQAKRGELVVFNAERNLPSHTTPEQARQIACSFLADARAAGESLDLFDPEVYRHFFHNLYATTVEDRDEILRLLTEMKFGTVGERFRLIEDNYHVPIVVRWRRRPHEREIERRLRAYADNPSRQTRRALQPYTVNVARWQHEQIANTWLSPIREDEPLRALSPLYAYKYDDLLGLDLSELSAPADVKLLCV
jgi:CRISPR-associated endonuclease/helicase Cas3